MRFAVRESPWELILNHLESSLSSSSSSLQLKRVQTENSQRKIPVSGRSQVNISGLRSWSWWIIGSDPRKNFCGSKWDPTWVKFRISGYLGISWDILDLNDLNDLNDLRTPFLGRPRRPMTSSLILPKTLELTTYLPRQMVATSDPTWVKWVSIPASLRKAGHLIAPQWPKPPEQENSVLRVIQNLPGFPL